MATVRQSIDVNQPLQTVYNQWTQFEEFPSFMEGVEAGASGAEFRQEAL